MTEESNDRIRKIEEQQNKLQDQVKASEVSLFELLLTYWKLLRDNPIALRKIWKKFLGESYSPLFNTFTTDIKMVLALNEEYFAATNSLERVREIASITNARVEERLGLEAGKIIEGGYMDTILQDQTAKRQVQQFFHRTRSLKNETQLKYDLREIVKGVKDEGGVISKTFDNYVFDTYQEADRLAQNSYAVELDLDAAIYTGGLIEGSRPFCIERNRKIFLRSEILLFGSSGDKWGGYSDKAAGKFSGKPKGGYDPLTQCGGHRCRHHLSWLSKEYAVRLDPTLKIVGNGLVRI